MNNIEKAKEILDTDGLCKSSTFKCKDCFMKSLCDDTSLLIGLVEERKKKCYEFLSCVLDKAINEQP